MIFSLEKTRVKLGTVLIETVLSGDHLYSESKSKSESLSDSDSESGNISARAAFNFEFISFLGSNLGFAALAAMATDLKLNPPSLIEFNITFLESEKIDTGLLVVSLVKVSRI